jgi:predicted ABC-type ATPase
MELKDFTMKQEPRVIIIAGPNGAGKTTFAREFLPLDAACPHFVNADLIAEGLSPFAPESAVMPAQQVMQQEFERLISARESFAFETTLAESGDIASIKKWQAAGYRVKLIFLQLDSAELALARAAHRALFSGIAIDEAAIRRDWAAGFENFEKLYTPLVDSWALYDNSGVQPMLLAWSASGAQTPIEIARDKDLRFSFNALRRATKRIHEMAMMTGTPIAISRNGVIEHISEGLENATTTVHEPAALYENS